jgi:hypothetical protein
VPRRCETFFPPYSLVEVIQDRGVSLECCTGVGHQRLPLLALVVVCYFTTLELEKLRHLIASHRMNCGFYLFIDEAGDEGLDQVRPVDPNGASEYFVLCGVLVRASRYQELAQSFNAIKPKIGMTPTDQLHFRDLDEDQKQLVISSLSELKFGLVAIVSNKRNMRRYRNPRCEAKNLEFSRGRYRTRKYNWFYNGLFRYLLERASAECKRWTHRAYGEVRSVRIVFSNRKDISSAQTGAYLLKL